MTGIPGREIGRKESETSIDEPDRRRNLFGRTMRCGIGLSGLSLFAAVSGPVSNRAIGIRAAAAFLFLLAALTLPAVGLRIGTTSIPVGQVAAIIPICCVAVSRQEALKVIRCVKARKPPQERAGMGGTICC